MNRVLTFALVVLLIVATALGFKSVADTRRLDETAGLLLRERDARAAAEKTAQDKLAALERQMDILRKENEALRARKDAPAATVAASDDKSAAPAAGGDAKTEGKKDGGDMMAGIKKMFDTPEGKEMMKAQQSMAMRMMYGDLAKELGLSDEEAKLVMDLLTERQMGAMSGMFKEGGIGEDSAAKMGKDMEDVNKKIETVLGADKFAKFKDYETTIQDRAGLNQVKQQMSMLGTPLDDRQNTELFSIMKEERKRMRDEIKAPEPTDVQAGLKMMQDEESLNKMIEAETSMQARVLERIRTQVTPDQFKNLEAMQKQHAEMMKFGIKAGAQFLKKK